MTTSECSERINNILKDLLSSKRNLYPKMLLDAMEYTVFAGGKRVRPYLAYITAEFLDVPIEYADRVALSVELIHTYSLIHDDLPCMDNDDFRRGRPSCHRKFHECVALLAGDALLNLAYETLFESVKDNEEFAETAFYIAKCAGGEGMVGGQAMEVTEPLNEDKVTEVCLKKTARLISAAIVGTAYFSYDAEKIKALTTYASALGLLFQLTDDLLDELKPEETSYLCVCGKEKTLETIARAERTACSALAKWGEKAKKLIEFVHYVTNRKF